LVQKTLTIYTETTLGIRTGWLTGPYRYQC
jgi:hypothetical protein